MVFHDLRQFLLNKGHTKKSAFLTLKFYVFQRIHALIYIIVAVFICITVRLIYVCVYTKHINIASTMQKIPPRILDRNNIIIATHLPTESVYLNALMIIEKKTTLELIQQIFPHSNHHYIEESITKGCSFIWLKRHITPKQKEYILQRGLVGCGFKEDWKRIYPFQNILSHVVGFRDVDDHATSGIEKYIDASQLSQDLQLSIDLRIQSIAHSALKKAQKKFSAKGGGVIILDIKNGEIIALCSLPDFDPNNTAERKGPATFNNMLQGAFEHGSVMKIFTLAQGLEEANLDTTHTLQTSAPLHIGKFVIKDRYPKKHNLTVAESFALSSNIGMVQIYKKTGPEKQKDFFAKMGIFDTPSIEIFEKAQNAEKENWSFTRGAIASYGYGIALSPLQFLVSAAATVSGYLISPTLLKRTKDTPEKNYKNPVALSPKTLDTMRKMLYQVTQCGTAKKAAFVHYGVGAKTGSSCKRSGKVGYNSDKHRAFLVAFFPIANPRYAILIMLDEPVGTKDTFFFSTAGWTVAPTAQKIIKRAGPMLKLPTLSSSEIAHMRHNMQVPGIRRAQSKAA